MRFGFLPVYMAAVGFDGTIIGLMVGFAFLVGGFTALPTARIRRKFASHWTILIVVGFTALGLGIVPLFQDIAGLSLATIVFGAGAGLGMAFAISLLSTVVSTEQLGLSIGLRITANRFSSFTIPIFAGRGDRRVRARRGLLRYAHHHWRRLAVCGTLYDAHAVYKTGL